MEPFVFLLGLALLNQISMALSDSIQQFNHTLNIAGLVETDGYFEWMKEIFEFTVSLINDHEDGWNDDILNDTFINHHISDPKCEASTSVDAFYRIKSLWKGNIDAVIGPRCSAGTLVTGMITNAEKIVQVTPTATSTELNEKESFPLVSRLVAPSDENGEVGAMIAMLQEFGWSRITIISTDSEYSNNYVNEFKHEWKDYEITTSEIVTLHENGTVDEESVKMVLDDIPVDDPSRNSRVILLVAYNEQACKILQIADMIDFQKDTIWIGTGAWSGRDPKLSNFSVPKLPGYIGLAPFKSDDEISDDFLNRLRKWQLGAKKKEWTEFPDYTTQHLVDSILAVAKAFSLTPHEFRKNASYVSSMLRSQSFSGISGPVSFTDDGYRRNPKYSIYNMQLIDGIAKWVQVGTVGTKIGSANITSSMICFAVAGCNLTEYPSDKYTIKNDWTNEGLISVILLCIVALFMVLICLRESIKEKNSMKKNMNEIQKRLDELRSIDEQLSNLDDKVKATNDHRAKLLLKRQSLQLMPDEWSDSKDILVKILPHEEEYRKVEDKLIESMSDAHISTLWRIQNRSLWTYYSFHKDRLAMNGIPHNEENVWHGTSSVDPAIIYNGKQDGFMIQFAQSGLWG
jgi:ABC-type branched-subunit amino acid transport system substrate-binding protein